MQVHATRLVGDLFVAHPDWVAYTQQKFQHRELQGYHPSRYVMIDFSHLGDEAHVTFYPAHPREDAVTRQCLEWCQYQDDWAIDGSLMSDEYFAQIGGMVINEFHVTFRVGNRREHVFYDVQGAFERQTDGVTTKHRAMADTVAKEIAHGLLVGYNGRKFVSFMR